MKYLFWSVTALVLAALPLVSFQDAGPYQTGRGVSAPKLIIKVEPAYTDQARDAKVEGTVVLGIVVGANGLARDVRVVRSLDSGLDASAANAVLQWKFQPGEKDGKPVDVFATVEVNFKLN